MSILSRHEIKFRVALTVIGIVGGIFLHPAIPLACIIVLAFTYRSLEALALGLWMDLVWQPIGFMHPLPYVTLIAIVIVWAFEPLRAQLLR